MKRLVSMFILLLVLLSSLPSRIGRADIATIAAMTLKSYLQPSTIANGAGADLTPSSGRPAVTYS